MTSEITEAVVEAAKRNLVNVDIPPGALPFGAKWCDVIVEAVLNATLTRADRTSQPAPDKEAGTGRKMVPIEPIETMVITAHGDEHCGHVYEAMIGAALPPPSADRNNIEAVRLADDAARKARQAASRLDPGSEKDVTRGLAHDPGHAALKWAALQREHDRRLLKGLKDAALALARDASSQTGRSPVAQIESPPLMSDRGTDEAFKKAFLRELKRFWPDISQGAASKWVNEYVDAPGIRKHGLSAPAAIELAHQFAYGFKE